jgi:hypothetical protein
MFAVRPLDYARKIVHVMLTYSYARLMSIVSIMIVTLTTIDMGTKWNSHPPLETLIAFLRALRGGVSMENGLNLRIVYGNCD